MQENSIYYTYTIYIYEYIYYIILLDINKIDIGLFYVYTSIYMVIYSAI